MIERLIRKLDPAHKFQNKGCHVILECHKGREVNTLPSLLALQLFASAARQSSITRAADEVGMTQSAVSRKIVQLEADLGIALFERHRRGIRLTPEGERYLSAIGPAIKLIMSATNDTRAVAEAKPLNLRVYSTFAVKWLLPRLTQFQALYPSIEVHLDTTVTPVVFDRDPVDLAIQFGTGDWPDVNAELLLADLIEPVCTPRFAHDNSLTPDSRTLNGVRLLDSHYRRADWDDWATFADVSLKGAHRMEFPSSLLTYQAASEGLGLAVGQTHLLAADLESKALVRPFSRAMQRQAGHYLVTPRDRVEPRRVRVFRRWLLASTAQPDRLTESGA